MYYYALKNSKKPKWKSLNSKTEKDAIIELSHGLLFTKSKHVVDDYLIITDEQLKPLKPKCFHFNETEINIINKILKIDIDNLTERDVEELGLSKHINKPYYLIYPRYYYKPCNMFMDLKELELLYIEQSQDYRADPESCIGNFEVYDSVTCEKLIIKPTITINLEIKKENSNETTK
jgi:hypothetical protein